MSGSFYRHTKLVAGGAVCGYKGGGRFDGHDFIDSAIQAGAAAALVQQQLDSSFPHVVVARVEDAFLKLAAYWRTQQRAMVIAVTGSCGKTTTRQLLQGIFSVAGKTLASSKSFNNQIGVPLTLLQISLEHQYYIQEVGANHQGEILPLVAAIQPDIAVITNAGSAHLEGFGDLDGVAQAKGELLAGLSSSGVAVLNRDDAYYSFWKGLLKGQRCITFSVLGEADVMAREIILDREGCPSFTLVCESGSVPVTLQLAGQHNVSNALAAAAAAHVAKLSLVDIQYGLQQATGEERRLQRHSGVLGLVIDDSYNANPLSVRSAIALLAHQVGETYLVLGDMLELGAESEAHHAQIGDEAKKAGIDYVFCYGNAVQATAQRFGEKGYYYTNQEALVRALRSRLHEKAVVLVKGSWSMNMQRVVAALLEDG